MLSGEAYKVYVSVFVEHRSDGTMLPNLALKAGATKLLETAGQMAS